MSTRVIIEENQNADCIYKTCCHLPSVRKNLYCSTYDCHYHRDLKPKFAVRPSLRYILDRKAWRRQHEKTLAWTTPSCNKRQTSQADVKPRSRPPRPKSADSSCEDRQSMQEFPDFCLLPEAQREEMIVKMKRRRHLKEKEVSRQTEKDLLREFQNMSLKPKSKYGSKMANWAVQRQIKLEDKFNRFAEAYREREEGDQCPDQDADRSKQATEGPVLTHEKFGDFVGDPLLPFHLPSYQLSLSRTPFEYSTRLRRLTDQKPKSAPRDPKQPLIIRSDALGAPASLWETTRSDRRRIRKRYLDDGHLYRATCFWK